MLENQQPEFTPEQREEFKEKIKLHQERIQNLQPEQMVKEFNKIFSPFVLKNVGDYKIDYFHFDDNLNLYTRSVSPKHVE